MIAQSWQLHFLSFWVRKQMKSLLEALKEIYCYSGINKTPQIPPLNKQQVTYFCEMTPTTLWCTVPDLQILPTTGKDFFPHKALVLLYHVSNWSICRWIHSDYFRTLRYKSVHSQLIDRILFFYMFHHGVAYIANVHFKKISGDLVD